MAADKDISTIFEGWDYVPDELAVRRIKGLDGKMKIQLRLDMGLLQMEVNGRPDGTRPFGTESVFDHHTSLLAQHLAQGRLEGVLQRVRPGWPDAIKPRAGHTQGLVRRGHQNPGPQLAATA